MPASKYCDDYPASDSLTFTNVALDGSTVDWTTRVQKTDCAQAITPSKDGAQVDLTWDHTA